MDLTGTNYLYEDIIALAYKIKDEIFTKFGFKVLIEFGFITTPRIARNLVKNSKIIKLTKITKHSKRYF